MSCKHYMIEPVGSHLKCFSCGEYMDDYSTEPLDPNDYTEDLLNEQLSLFEEND